MKSALRKAAARRKKKKRKGKREEKEGAEGKKKKKKKKGINNLCLIVILRLSTLKELFSWWRLKFVTLVLHDFNLTSWQRLNSGKKGRKKKRKRRRGEEDEGPSEGELRMAAPVQQHYYPTPQNLMKKRCAFVSEAKPVVCTICDGIHYRFEVDGEIIFLVIGSIWRSIRLWETIWDTVRLS